MTSLAEGAAVGRDADVAIVFLWIMSFLVLALQGFVNKLVGRPWFNARGILAYAAGALLVGWVVANVIAAMRGKESFATCCGQNLTVLIALPPIIVVGHLCAREFRQYKAWRKRLSQG
ncbi:hypothetical protein [Achromobacter ruhlandii]|uniref:hypothetical protein n=1 Tax=Achromobacter ruhlandii TaxID=72557 RepID=UPI0012E93697|nr:hypothetical protein [Achromobacter ruhlandii]